jgi:hypothetical protein
MSPRSGRIWFFAVIYEVRFETNTLSRYLLRRCRSPVARLFQRQYYACALSAHRLTVSSREEVCWRERLLLWSLPCSVLDTLVFEYCSNSESTNVGLELGTIYL